MPAHRKNMNAAEQMARIERQREAARLRKREERARKSPEEMRAQKAEEDRLCLDWGKLLPFVDKNGAGGCWVWRGGYYLTWASQRPIVRTGQYGRVFADVAAWLLARGKTELPRGTRLLRECGNLECVNPEHGAATNQVVERAKRRMGASNVDLRKQKQQEGQAAERRTAERRAG